MDSLLINGAKAAANAVRGLFTTGQSRMGNVASDPKKTAQFVTLFLIAHFTLVTLVVSGMACTEWGRKKIRKYWRLSKQGPFHKFVVWFLNLFVRLFVFLSGDRLIEDPSGCKPKFTTIQTQVNRIVLNWTAQRSSKWTPDSYELQIWKTPAVKGAPSAIGSTTDGKDAKWETCAKGENLFTCDCHDLAEGVEHKFRVRTFNKKGTSAWNETCFWTRLRPELNGGWGPGYTWSQATKEINMVINVKEESKGKDFSVTCKGGKLSILECGNPIVEGELWKAAKGSEITWSLGVGEDGKRKMFVGMEKMEKTNRRTNHW
eukprot:CAMPEP_0173385272 /NCGR_PEP_ID=MMETSP1356-20130122/7882_1 /TAXON_ID=77927 ORGANISM="Hemiselmis virescens, Strain PCC157" /NCGR_SAMPLE_ID=MMETSP1356 /ASSEMBLY_ACC=CAM_ASM_000847 /LENGTH=316 /DNA_ID=CAMNT_0014340999 /DNA_START=1 /DNA_END=948 /DNA_ORIENTATION=+